MKAFWWSPIRMPRTIREEVRGSSMMWARQSARTGRPFTNFGDELSRYALEYGFRTKISWSRPQSADILGIGSILDFYLLAGARGAVVWGTGSRDGNVPHDGEARALQFSKVLAVRGPRTRDALGCSDRLPMGDPGVLAAKLAADGQRRSKVARRTLLPHFRSWSSPEGVACIKEASKEGFSIIYPTDSPTRVIRKIMDSDVLLSSSLHGIIVAHSVGTPVIPVSLERGGSESRFKFEDYFATVKGEYKPLDLKEVLSPRFGKYAEESVASAPAFEEITSQIADALISVARRA